MIAERIRERALAAPDHVAIDGARRVTYGELDARARAIASHVRAAGAGRDDVVVVRSDDRAAIALGMCGVLYAGAAFVVITSDVPVARVDRMTRDAGARVVVDDEVIAHAAVPASFEIPPKRAPRISRTSSSRRGRPARRRASSSRTRAFCPCSTRKSRRSRSTGGAVAWVLSPLFDASISDVFTALVSGATLVLGAIRSAREPLRVDRSAIASRTPICRRRSWRSASGALPTRSARS